VDETSATTPEATASAVPAQDPDEKQPDEEGGRDGVPGFRARGRARRRLSFLRKARELAYRDLGGLVFDLHRFGQRNDPLVLAKLGTLQEIDTELRSLETALEERHTLTILREAGVTACPRCAAIHSAEDNFCPHCGLPMSRHVDLPIAGPATSGPTAPRAGALPVADPAAAAGASPRSAAAPGAAPAAPAGDSARSPVAAEAPATTPAERAANGPQAPPGMGQPAGSDADGPTEILRPPPASR
jgi:hypothetical protein